MIRVKFNDVQEYLEELRGDAGPAGAGVLDGVVRLTRRWQPTATPPEQVVRVVSGYVRGGAVPQVVTLDSLAGYTLGGSDQTTELAARRMAAVEDAARALGLDVRAGSFEVG